MKTKLIIAAVIIVLAVLGYVRYRQIHPITTYYNQRTIVKITPGANGYKYKIYFDKPTTANMPGIQTNDYTYAVGDTLIIEGDLADGSYKVSTWKTPK